MTPLEILNKHKIPFSPKGRDYVIRCLSPNHEDKNPSLRIDSTTGIFNCLSCGFRGNLFNHFNYQVSFLETKRRQIKNLISEKLADNIGLDIPENAVFYDDSWRNISPETYRAFDAFQHNDKHFIGRLVFPVRGISGKIVGFIGRHMTMNHTPKYLMHPTGAKFPLFPPKPEIYNGRIILVEGIFDMLNLYDKGLKNVVCSFGTAKLIGKEATDKLNLYKLQGVIGVDIFFDGDKAGQEAAAQVRELCERNELDVRNVSMPGKDPGELTASQVIKLKETLYG
jgi:DNA primase